MTGWNGMESSPAYEVDHVDEVVHVPEIPCFGLDVCNLRIEALEYGIGPEGGDVVVDLWVFLVRLSPTLLISHTEELHMSRASCSKSHTNSSL